MLQCPLESFYVANSEQPVCYANPPAVVLDIFSRQYVQNYNETIRNSAIGLISYITQYKRVYSGYNFYCHTDWLGQSTTEELEQVICYI